MTEKRSIEPPKIDPPFEALKWWRELNGASEGRGRNGKDRAALARLRRASPADAVYEEATLRLFRALGFEHPARLPRVAALAVALASIREDRPGRFGRQIGREKFDDDRSAPLKIGRFKRLLDAESEDEIAVSFRRAIAILGDVASVRDVARIILGFDDEGTKTSLVFDYYGARDFEPSRPERNARPDISAA